MSRLQNNRGSLGLSAKIGCAWAAGSPCSSREDGDLLTDSVVQLRRSSGTKPSERNRMEMTGARVRATSGCSLFFTPRQTSHGLRVHEFTALSLCQRVSFFCVTRSEVIPLPLKVRQLENKLTEKQPENCFDNKHHLASTMSQFGWHLEENEVFFFSKASLKRRWKPERSPLFLVCVDLPWLI